MKSRLYALIFFALLFIAFLAKTYTRRSRVGIFVGIGALVKARCLQNRFAWISICVLCGSLSDWGFESLHSRHTCDSKVGEIGRCLEFRVQYKELGANSFYLG